MITTTKISADERHYLCRKTNRSFFAYRTACGNGYWQIEEIDQPEVHGSKCLKVWKNIKKTANIEGYVEALVDLT